MDELKKELLGQLEARGITADQLDMGAVDNLVNTARVAQGGLDPEHQRRAGLATPPKEVSPTLMQTILGGAGGALKAVGQGALGTAQMGGRALYDAATGNLQDLGQVGKEAVQSVPQTFTNLRDVTQRGLAGEAKPAEIGGAWGGAAMLGLGGVVGLERGGRMLPGGAASRAAQLAKDMKFSEGVQAERAGVAADPLNQATAIRRGTVVPRGNASASTPYVPGQGPSTVPPQGEGIGIAPKFEEDVMPRAMEPTQGAAYPVGGGVHPELQQLYDDVLGPAK